MKILLSSETYRLELSDLLQLDSEKWEGVDQIRCPQRVVLLIGNSSKGEQDRLICGREAIEEALQRGESFLSVRIAFRSNLPRGLSFLSAFKKIRKKYKQDGTHIYHMSAKEIRRMRIERSVRNKENAYDFSSAKWRPAEDQRLPKYQRLIESMQQRGFDDREPVSIMLCRSFGVLDSLNQGHHRVSAALDAGVDRIAVQFTATAKAPMPLALLLFVPAKLKRALINRTHFKD